MEMNKKKLGAVVALVVAVAGSLAAMYQHNVDSFDLVIGDACNKLTPEQLLEVPTLCGVPKLQTVTSVTTVDPAIVEVLNLVSDAEEIAMLQMLHRQKITDLQAEMSAEWDAELTKAKEQGDALLEGGNSELSLPIEPVTESVPVVELIPAVTEPVPQAIAPPVVVPELQTVTTEPITVLVTVTAVVADK